jgi:hypothetical protein
MISHMMEMMLAARSVMWGGTRRSSPAVPQRISWIGGGCIGAPWLDRMDRQFRQ